MKKTVLFFLFIFTVSLGFGQNAWINEIHYDNDGADIDEIVEVVIENPGSYTLSLFQVNLYNGNGGSSYNNKTLDTFTIGNTSGNYTIYYFNYTEASTSIQNGDPDGLALSYNGTLISGQFLSYEGTFTAIDGPAIGVLSIDIGVSEEDQPEYNGKSLQLLGTGTQYSDFTWEGPYIATPGAVNNDGSNDQVLPVTLSSFTAQYINDTPTLCWTTQSETNNSGWNIYRGESNEALSNEETYQLNLSLGLIPGAGTTSEPTDYSFEDVFPVFQETTYFYWLESVDYSGETEIYGPISLTIPEDEWENPNSPEIPKNYGLHQNYPNPFNPNTEISFMMKENCIAELSVYNIKGEKIATLFQNKSVSKDELIRTNWDGKDDFGKAVSSGIYLYKLRTNKENFVRKMILLK